MTKKLLLPALISAALAGCAIDPAFHSMQDTVRQRAGESVQSFKHERPTVVREHAGDYLDFQTISAKQAPGDVTLRASAAPYGPLISQIAAKSGYSVLFADGISVSKPVTAEFNQATAQHTIRTLAWLAGYVAVFNEQAKTVTITDVATFTYKLPPSLFQPRAASYSIGGNPVSSSSSGSGVSQGGTSGFGGSSGSGSRQSGLQANFTITGKAATSPQSLTSLIQQYAGKNAEVVVTETGLVTVRSNAQALMRVTDLVKNLCKDALTQVSIEASVVEATLKDDFEQGVDWKRVLNNAGGTGGNLTIDFKTASAVALPTFKATFTKATIEAVVASLRKFTDARVVSRPRLVAANHSPATYFDGTQQPYMGNVNVTPIASGSSTVYQLSGNVSYAVDGISFSVIPDVLDDKRVQITLIPVLSNILGFEKFDLGGGTTSTAPKQASKDSFMQVTAESGRTIVLGGLRYATEDRGDSVGPVPLLLQGRSYLRNAREVAILLRANIVPAPDYNPIVSESL